MAQAFGRRQPKGEHAPTPVKRHTGPRKRINLALQGGGAHGAFTWGVLDHLLADGRLVIDGMSGTSAGAINAVMVADGLARGGPEEARQRLAAFWRAASLGGDLPVGQRLAIERMFKVSSSDDSPMRIWMDAMARFLSPYDINPLNINPLKELIEKFVDFDAVRGGDLALYIAATNVFNGELRVFPRAEITADAVMASACLPFLFRAVEIDGVPYWDGGYAGNPVVFPHFYDGATEDVLIVQINPVARQRTPRSNREIMSRVNEITFNAPLLAELRAMEKIDALIDDGKLLPGPFNNGVRRMRLHRIVLPHVGGGFDTPRSKLKTDYEFFQTLHKLGRRAARRFLDEHFDAVGERSTLDLRPEEAAEKV
ncbi:MAG: patatin-like phospholipase family protein [Rhizobiales bacterium]|nr:patatin-like phospholipase family protein [Hyphomicrobiales bacterium]